MELPLDASAGMGGHQLPIDRPDAAPGRVHGPSKAVVEPLVASGPPRRYLIDILPWRQDAFDSRSSAGWQDS